MGVCPVCPSSCTNNESKRLLEIHSAPGMVRGGLHAFPLLNPQTSPTREVLLAFPFPGENLGLKRLNSIKEVGDARLDPCRCATPSPPNHTFASLYRSTLNSGQHCSPCITGLWGRQYERVRGVVGGLHWSGSLEKGWVSSCLWVARGRLCLSFPVLSEGRLRQGVPELCGLCVCVSGLCVAKQQSPCWPRDLAELCPLKELPQGAGPDLL